MRYPVSILAMLCAVAGLSPAVKAEIFKLGLSHNIVAACTISQPDTVTLPNITASAFADKEPGTLLSDYSAILILSVSCPGTSSYILTMTPGGATPTKTNCLATDKDFVRFCVRDNGSILDFSQGSVNLTKPSTSVVTTYTVVPAVGTGDITAGTVNGIMTVMVTPL